MPHLEMEVALDRLGMPMGQFLDWWKHLLKIGLSSLRIFNTLKHNQSINLQLICALLFTAVFITYSKY